VKKSCHVCARIPHASFLEEDAHLEQRLVLLKKVVKKKAKNKKNCKRGGKCNTLCYIHTHHILTKVGKKKERRRGEKILW
jgi:hypothetical protein